MAYRPRRQSQSNQSEAVIGFVIATAALGIAVGGFAFKLLDSRSCEPSEFEKHEVIFMREEAAVFGKNYYVTLNNSIEYLVDQELFSSLEVGMHVYLTNCNSIIYIAAS